MKTIILAIILALTAISVFADPPLTTLSNCVISNAPTRMCFYTTTDGSATPTEKFRIGNSGGIFAYGLKAGTDQANAGAAANELYRDTDDNTIKIGV